MPIVDFRLRPKTQEFVTVAENPVFSEMMARRPKPYQAVAYSLEKTIQEMDASGITVGVVPGRDLETTFQWKVENDYVAEVVRQYPDRFVGFAGVDPNKGMAAVYELERSVKELGLRGVSIDPYMHRLDANDKKCYPVYAKACELGVPVMITTGPGSYVPDSVMDYAAPRRIDEVAKDFPDLVIVASHGGYPWVMEMIGVAMRNRHVYFDISSYELAPGNQLYIDAANTYLTQKVLYASAYPFNEWPDHLKRYDRAKYTDAAWDGLMYKNAARILGLNLE